MKRNEYFDTVYQELSTAVNDPDLAVKWIRPWAAGQHSRLTPRSVGTGKAYRGINRWWLGTRCYTSPWWLTFRQAKKLGGSVRKGEKSSVGMYYQVIEKKTESGAREAFPIFKTFRVFNVEQCDLPQEALDRLAERLDAICPPSPKRPCRTRSRRQRPPPSSGSKASPSDSITAATARFIRHFRTPSRCPRRLRSTPPKPTPRPSLTKRSTRPGTDLDLTVGFSRRRQRETHTGAKN